jgi:hypothetical protein
MRVLRPDRVVKMLTGLASMAYFAFWFCTPLVLIGLPAAKVLGGTDSHFYYELDLPVTVPAFDTAVSTIWGAAPLKLDKVRGVLQLPIPMLPWPTLALLWTYTAAALALTLAFLQNLRRIFQRVRDGAAFDAKNAVRLRTLGVLLLALVTLKGIAEVATSIAVRRALTAGSPLGVPAGLHIDGPLVLIALVLVALAEVFRRGAELEHEQSLVV